MMTTISGKNCVNGIWTEGRGELFASITPANNDRVWEGHASNPDDVDQAVSSARSAFPAWSRTSLEERLAIIERFRQLVDEAKEDLAETISLETGKVLWETRTEVAGVMGKIAVSLKAYQDRCPQREQEIPNGRAITRHHAHGVLAVFGPFNFPAHLPNGHIVPAFLAGNTVVFKPSEYTPMIAEKIVDLWHEAGLPPGVLNLVQGARETGQALSTHQQIDGILFTGSAATGLHLSEALVKTPGKILAIEAGGNNPLVAWNISDYKAAAYHIIQSAFISSGQRCTCARRLILPEGDSGDKVLAALVEMTKSISVGAYDETPAPFMGPVVSKYTAEKLLEAQKKLIDSGAESIVEMKLLKEGTALLSPGIVDSSNISNRKDEEYFGPLLQVIRVKTFDDAITEANHTAYGLSAGLLSDQRSDWERFVTEVRAGIINWNQQTTGARGDAPFGGLGMSGNHRPSAYYAADYCAYPVATIEIDELKVPATITPGITL